MQKFSLIVVTLWVGALWAIGFVAYILFKTLPDKPQLAGNLAGQLFTIVRYIGMASALFLLVQRLLDYGTASLKQAYFWAIFFMLILVLVEHFGIQPILAQLKADALPNDVLNSVFKDRFGKWHGVAGVAYLVECLLGFVLVLKVR
jgi:Domain of unknown function (DUF4149)